MKELGAGAAGKSRRSAPTVRMQALKQQWKSRLERVGFNWLVKEDG
jgi:hypothetical protein